MSSTSSNNNGNRKRPFTDDTITATVATTTTTTAPPDNSSAASSAAGCAPSLPKHCTQKKKTLYLFIWLRESPKWIYLMLCMGFISQLRRIVSSAIFYARENGYELDIRSICYGKMVDRRETEDDKALLQLRFDLGKFVAEAIKKNINVSPYDKVLVVATEILRFGSNPDTVKEFIRYLSTLSVFKGKQTGVEPKLVTLKEALLDDKELCDCADTFKKLLDKIDGIREDHGNHKDPSIGISYLSNDAKRENEGLRESQCEIYQEIIDNDSRLPSTISSWLVIKSVTTSSSTPDTSKICGEFVTTMCNIRNCGLENGALTHSTEEIDPTNLHKFGSGFMKNISQENTSSSALLPEEYALYFRKSPGGNKVVEAHVSGGDGEEIALPLYQLSWHIAYLEKFRKKGATLRIRIYYDQNKLREDCNPALMTMVLDTWKHNIKWLIAHKTNRLTSHLVFYQLLKYICDKKCIQMRFPFHHGKNIDLVVENENERKVKEQKAYRKYIAEVNEKRIKLSEQDKKMSLDFLKIGSGKTTEDEKLLLSEILTKNHLNSPLFDKFFEQIEGN
ncbi:hypothetical protein ACHAWC_009801 [Mediolabrus comicus]